MFEVTLVSEQVRKLGELSKINNREVKLSGYVNNGQFKNDSQAYLLIRVLKKKPCPITFEGPSGGEGQCGSQSKIALHQIFAKLLSEHTASG